MKTIQTVLTVKTPAQIKALRQMLSSEAATLFPTTAACLRGDAESQSAAALDESAFQHVVPPLTYLFGSVPTLSRSVLTGCAALEALRPPQQEVDATRRLMKGFNLKQFGEAHGLDLDGVGHALDGSLEHFRITFSRFLGEVHAVMESPEGPDAGVVRRALGVDSALLYERLYLQLAPAEGEG